LARKNVEENEDGMNEKEKMKMQYRDHRDVMASILETLSSSSNDGDGTGMNITRLVYGTGAQWSSLLILLAELRERKMIVEKTLPGMKLNNNSRNHRIFFITPKGIRFLRLYRELKEYLKNDND
jgi:predicted transcriptional regulator